MLLQEGLAGKGPGSVIGGHLWNWNILFKNFIE